MEHFVNLEKSLPPLRHEVAKALRLKMPMESNYTLFDKGNKAESNLSH